MIDVGSNYSYVKDLISKNDGAYLSPEEYERYANASSEEMYKDFLGERTNPQITFGKNRLIDQRLMVYKKTTPPISAAGGLIVKPVGLKYILSMYTVGGVVVKPLDEERKVTIKKDPLASPNAEDMYYNEENLGYRLVGQDSASVVLDYLEKPTKCKYAYTKVSGRPVYDPSNSVQFKWNESEEEELTNRILAKAGLSMKDPTVIQVSNNNKLKE